MAEKFSEFFSNTVTNLEIQFKCGDIISNTTDTDPVLRAISKYSMHPSIRKLMNSVTMNIRIVSPFDIRRMK